MLDELLKDSTPVAAAFPPPNMQPLLGEIDSSVPTIVCPSMFKFVFPYTIAVVPLPPAYILPLMLPLETSTYVFSFTIPSSPPPYIFVFIIPPKYL